MKIRASIGPLSWENTFFSVDSTIVRFGQHAPVLTADMLQPWSRVRAKVPTANTHKLGALQQLDFSLIEGEVDFVLSIMCAHGDSGAQVAQTTDIPALRQLAGWVLARSHFRTPWYTVDASARFYAQWIENAVLGTFDHQCLIFCTPTGDIRDYVSLRELDATDARIGLLVERGAGAELMQAALCWARTRGKTTLCVATQMGNTTALKRYIHGGADVRGTAYWLYR